MRQDFTGWTIVFDLDGTLVETAPDLHAALNHTLAEKGLGPVPIEDIRMMIGDGAKALIRKGLSWHAQPIDEADLDSTLWPIFITHYLANITRLSHLFDEARTTLQQLKTLGFSLTVCTNKTQILAMEVLKGLDIDHLFDATLGGDITVSKKPDGAHILETLALSGGDRARAIMIGDSTTDERAARNAGLPFVFLTLGYGELSGDPYPAMRVINHWRELQPAILELTASD